MAETWKIRTKKIAAIALLLTIASQTVFASDCRETGCPSQYRCMADGECIHSSISTQEYCNLGYREHGLAYESVNSESCSNIGLVCREIEKKCGGLSQKTGLLEERADECIRLQRMCLQCRGDCELKNNVNGVKNIIYAIAAGITVLVIIVSAIQLSTSEEEAARTNAKKAISYSILALIILVAAVEVVEYIWASFALANTYAPTPNANLKTNNESCRTSHECLSGYCTNSVCCDQGQCGLNLNCYNTNYKRPDDGTVCSGGRWKNENNKPCTQDINCLSNCCNEGICGECPATTTTTTTTTSSTTTTLTST